MIRSSAARILIVSTLIAATLAVGPAAQAIPVCGDQFGTASYDDVRTLATNGTDLWAGGNVGGSLDGQPYKGGGFDGYIREYDSTCTWQWTRTIGTKGNDNLHAAAADAAGNVYAVGFVTGKLKGQRYMGSGDAFIRSWDVNGNVRWTHQFGTKGGDAAYAVAVIGGRVFVGGSTGGSLAGQPYKGQTDSYVRAYATSGKLLWTDEFGTKQIDEVDAMTAYQRHLFAGGFTMGKLKGQTYAGDGDAYVREFSPSGVAGFTSEFGTSGNDGIGGMGADASGVVVAGTTMGSFPTFTNQGVQDGFVYAMDTSGNESWVTEFGTSQQDLLKAMALNGSTVELAGDSFGGLGGGTVSNDEPWYGSVSRTDGTGFSALSFGTSSADEGNALVDFAGWHVVGGDTFGTEWGGTNYGSADGYLYPCCS